VFANEPTEEEDFPDVSSDGWIDSRGTSHGNWCREIFCQVTCKWCGQSAWYFQCSHGCKVYFHDVPWEGGEWDANCPEDPRVDNTEY
jgi:hypothetical protein